MVGVLIKSSTLVGPRNTVGAATSRAFIAGVTERGRLTPVPVRSIVEYQTEFGTNQPFTASMYRCAQTFFEEGGSELIVCRAVGTTPTVGTLVSQDRTPTTPLPTLRWDAANPGAWAGGLRVTVTAGAVLNSVTIAVFLGPDRVSYVRDKTSVADIVTAFAGDPYVRATDLAPVSVYPVRLPALIASVPLTGGNDDRATVTIALVAAALDQAGNGYGAGAVAVPGYNAIIAGTLLIAHAKAHRRVAVLAGDVDSDLDELGSMASLLTIDGEYAGLFAPWVQVPDGSGVATVSPEGFVLGVRARAMNLQGFWQAPAGARSTARFVRGAVLSYDSAAINGLADAKVSGITTIANDLMLYGWRALGTNVEQFALLNARDAANTVTELVEATLQPFVFETIDGTGQLLARVKGALVGALQPIEDAGGFTGKFDADGKMVNPAFTVSAAVLSETALSAVVVFRLSGTAESIEVSVIKAAFNASI